MDFRRLPFINLSRNAGRSIGLALLCALLAFALFAGVMATTSLQNGLQSLSDRLGADIIVAPDEAKSKVDLKEVLLNGTPAQFYMDKSYVERIAALDGVEAVSPQYYLATVKAGCCTMPVQVIGFDPKTDFSIQPWVARAYAHDLQREDVVTGSNVSGAAGSTIMFYGVECRIAARLDETGTQLDNAVFATNETLQDLIEGSKEQGLAVLENNDPNEVVSTVQVKVANGHSVSQVADEINLHVRGVSAVQTRAMISGVSDSMGAMSQMVGMLAAVVAIGALVFLIVAFALSARSRVREFAVLRMAGASRSMLSRVSITESLTLGVLGAVVGVALGALVFAFFGRLLETSLSVPFLIPSLPTASAYACGAILVTIAACVLTSIVTSRRLTTVDAGQVLREG